MFGMPSGISLGRCALCGEDFLSNILFGEEYKEVKVQGIDETLAAHAECVEKYSGKSFSDMPPKSPVRQAFERSA